MNQRMRSSKPRAFTAWRRPNVGSAYRLCPRTHRIFKYVLCRTKVCFLKSETLQSLLLSGVCGTAPRCRYFGFEPKPLRMSGACTDQRAVSLAVTHNDTGKIRFLRCSKMTSSSLQQTRRDLKPVQLRTRLSQPKTMHPVCLGHNETPLAFGLLAVLLRHRVPYRQIAHKNAVSRDGSRSAWPAEYHKNIRDCLWWVGAIGRNRTSDTRIFSPLLYRLSYNDILTFLNGPFIW